MILYVNGDNHTVAAQAINDYCFANDDFSKIALGRKAHPNNLEVSWGSQLAKLLKLALVSDAECDSSNERILRSTYEFLETLNAKKYSYTMIVIGWSNWTRTEWIDSNNELIQINPGVEPNDKTLSTQYKTYSRTVKYADKQLEWHNKIWDLHKLLDRKKIPHLFFNSNDSFENIPIDHFNWKNNYINPYHNESCFFYWANENGFKHNDQYHFGPDAQLSWAQYLFKHLTEHKV